MRRALLILALMTATAQAQTFRLSGFVLARGISTRSQPSWLTGGLNLMRCRAGRAARASAPLKGSAKAVVLGATGPPEAPSPLLYSSLVPGGGLIYARFLERWL